MAKIQQKEFVSGTKIISIGGINEDRIGGNSSIIEHTDESGQVTRIMQDMGSMFTPYESDFNVALPNADKYFDRYDSKTKKLIKATEPVDAMFITHAHEDHIGAIIHFVKMGYRLPTVYGSRFTKNMVNMRLKEEGVIPYSDVEAVTKQQPDNLKAPKVLSVKAGDNIDIGGNVIIEPFVVSHSIIESLGFHTMTFVDDEPSAILINNGDFLTEENMPIGQSFSLDAYKDILRRKKAPTMVSFVDSTSTSPNSSARIGFDQAVENTLSVINDNPDRNLIISPVIARSLQNISIDFEVARKLGTKVFLDGKWLGLSHKAMKMSGYTDFDDVIYNGDLSQYMNDKKISKKYIVNTGAFAQGMDEYEKNQGEGTRINMSSSVKMALGLHKDVRIDNRTLVIGRQRIIEGINGESGPKMYQLLARQGAKVVLTPSGKKVADFEEVKMQDSGHINAENFANLLDVVKEISPDIIYIPHHGDTKQCEDSIEILKAHGVQYYKAKNAEELIFANGSVQEVEGYKPPFTWIAGKEVLPDPLRPNPSVPLQGKWEYYIVDKYYMPIEKMMEIDNPVRYSYRDGGYYNNQKLNHKYSSDLPRTQRMGENIPRKMSRKEKKRLHKDEERMEKLERKKKYNTHRDTGRGGGDERY